MISMAMTLAEMMINPVFITGTTLGEEPDAFPYAEQQPQFHRR
jgi:hypothetical protein